MDDTAKDASVLKHIEHLVAEEHKLFSQGKLDDAQGKRLADIQVQLDQCWDLLRQRRALREYGRDAGEAQLRPPGTVEKYEG